MIAGEGHLGGADEVEVVGLEPVDLLAVRAEKPCALHDLGPNQHGRDDERETVVGGEPDRELHEAELQERAVTGEEVEPRAGNLGSALQVEEPERFTKGHMIFRIGDGRRLADGVENHEVVLAARGHAVDDDVRNRHVRGGERLVGVGLLRLGGLDRLGQSLGLLEKRRSILLGRRTDQLARGLLLGAQIVGRRDGGPTVRVGRQQCVDEGGILAAGTL